MGTTTEREGIWLVAEFEGNRGVLARVKGQTLNPSIKNEILASKRIEAVECFDFFCPLRPVMLTDERGQPVRGPDGKPQQGVTRDPLITGNHFLLEPAPCYLRLELAAKIIFVDEMSPGDQANYSSYIKIARDKVEEQVEAIKAASARIVLPQRGQDVPVSADGTIDLGAMTRSP